MIVKLYANMFFFYVFLFDFMAGGVQHTVNPLVTEIGQVITGNAQGRKMDKEITVFDSSGIAIQDLFVSAKLLDLVDRKAAE
ncbi:hypothetical protein VroAM7_51110 (plasmid) [Vibrio rotiferianus]|uniref:Ornithine cyclodeaminase n=3 Tax=Vibrio TaxID=662 RepID=A0A510IH85_9VIBR|nr:hypothetical protein VroAM7_51110 [Vibrio rotiferianus]